MSIIYLCPNLFQKVFENLKVHIRVIIIKTITFFDLASHYAKKRVLWIMSLNACSVPYEVGATGLILQVTN